MVIRNLMLAAPLKLMSVKIIFHPKEGPSSHNIACPIKQFLLDNR